MGDAWDTYESPLGPLTVVLSTSGALKALRFHGDKPLDEVDRAPVAPVAEQLDQYFAGERQSFELAVELSGSPLQMQVWERLREIPYGSTVSYGQVAGDVDPAVFPDRLEPHEWDRAVGTEVGRTPVPIVIPCHRVLGADGSLTGYGGGLDRKRALLDLESSQLALPLVSAVRSPIWSPKLPTCLAAFDR